MRIKESREGIMPALFAACLASAPAAADNNWRFNAVPYVWTSGMEGRASHDALHGPALGLSIRF